MGFLVTSNNRKDSQFDLRGESRHKDLISIHSFGSFSYIIEWLESMASGIHR
jgi:hypothetical protein